MFGRKKRTQAIGRLAFDGSGFMTLAQATLAVTAEHSDPQAARRYCANILLGAMAAYGIGPDDVDERRIIWYSIRDQLGGEGLGSTWQMTALFPLDATATGQVAELIGPLLFQIPPEQLFHTAAAVLAPFFGADDAAQLQITEQMACVITGLTLRTLFDDVQADIASGVPGNQVDDRITIGSLTAAVYVLAAAKTEAARRAREEGRL